MEQNKQSGLGIAGLVLGIIAILTSCFLIGGFIGIVGIILSIIGVVRKGFSKGAAIAGIALNSVAIVVLFFMFGAVLVSSGSSEKEDKSKEKNIIEESIEEEPQEYKNEDLAGVGEYVKNNEWKISLLDAKEYDSIDDEFYSDKPEIEGNKFVVLFFEVENVSNEDNHFNIFYFESYIDGYVANNKFLLNDPENYKSLGGDLAKGKKMKGYLAYEVSPDWEEIEFSYKNWIGNTEKIATFVVTPENISN